MSGLVSEGVSVTNTTLLVSCYDSKMKTIMLPKGLPDPLPELAAYLEPFAPLFRRSTSRRSLERYVTGLLSDLPRKNCEAIAQALAVLVTVKATGAAGPGRKAGCSGSAHCRGRKGIPSGFSVTCPQTPPCLAWSNWRICAGRSSSSMRMPKANVASIAFKGAVGMACICIWLWWCWPTPSSCSSLWGNRFGPIQSQQGQLFSPVRQLSLPACHCQVLVLLFQDVVLWLIETEQVEAFRPRRN